MTWHDVIFGIAVVVSTVCGVGLIGFVAWLLTPLDPPTYDGAWPEPARHVRVFRRPYDWSEHGL